MNARRLILSVLVAVLGALALAVAPALALAQKPKVLPGSEGVSAVRSAEATFAATIDPNGEQTSYAFEYATGEATLLEGKGAVVDGAPPAPLLTGTGEQVVEVPTALVLSPGTTYYYRVEASNATGVAFGTMESFTTVPTPFTDAPTGPVGASTVTLNGHLTPLNENVAAQYHFVYDLGGVCTGAGEGSTPVGEAGEGAGTKAESAVIAGLQPNAEYTACFVTSNEFGSEMGPEVHFTTAVASPTVAGESALAVKATEVSLEAQVNPNNQDTHGYFQYGTSAAVNGLGSLTGATQVPVAPGADLGSAFGVVPAGPVALTGLMAGTTYYYQAVASSTTGTTYGTVQSFTTVPAPHTGEVKSVTATTATFTGTLAPLNSTVKTEYAFEYNLGAEPVCTGESATPIANAHTGTGAKLVSKPVVELQPDHEYSVCLVSSNEFGSEVDGVPVYFKTLAVPPTVALESESVSGVTSLEAAFGATIDPKGEETTYTFEYATSEAALLGGTGTKVASAIISGGEQGVAVPTGQVLAPGTSYWYRVVVEDETTTQEGKPVVGEVKQFATLPTPHTEEAKSITATTATFTGTLTPLNPLVPAEYNFYYNVGAEPFCTGESVTTPTGASTDSVSTEVIELQPDREYTVCLVSLNAFGGEVDDTPPVYFTTHAAPPAVFANSESASTTVSNEATFAAVIDPNNQETSYAFEYATKATGETLEGTVETIPGAEPFPANEYGERGVSATTGPVLEPGETYYYRVTATNKTGTIRGPVEQFRKNPIVEGESNSGVTATAAKLEATINPDLQPTKYSFEYSTKASGEPLVLEDPITIVKGAPPAALLPPEFTGLSVSTVLSGLEAGKTYYYRVVAENETTKKTGKPIEGEVQPFTTVAAYTLNLTKTGIGKGTISSAPAGIDCGASCSFDFEENTQVTLTAMPAVGSQFAGWSGGGCSGTGTCTVTLTAQTAVTAEFRQPSPVVVTEGSSAVTAGAAVLAGKVSPEGVPTEACEFEYGPTTAYGSVAPCASNPGSGTAYTPVTAALEGLSGRTTYHYRLTAKNAGGVTDGTDMQFTTPESEAEAEAEAQTLQQQREAAARKQQAEAEVTAAAQQREEEAAAAVAAANKRQEEAAAATAKKKHEEASAAAAKQKKQAEEKARNNKKKHKKKKKKKTKNTKKGKKS
jgi:phosphodiesterase/alkaline phosphatase D-like protein